MEYLLIDRCGETDTMIANNDRHHWTTHIQVRKTHFHLKLCDCIRGYFLNLLSLNR